MVYLTAAKSWIAMLAYLAVSVRVAFVGQNHSETAMVVACPNRSQIQTDRMASFRNYSRSWRKKLVCFPQNQVKTEMLVCSPPIRSQSVKIVSVAAVPVWTLMLACSVSIQSWVEWTASAAVIRM